MQHNFEAIQTIRRLIGAGRYDEAYALMKQTNHPQIPALERKLRSLITVDGSHTPRKPLSNLMRW